MRWKLSKLTGGLEWNEHNLWKWSRKNGVETNWIEPDNSPIKENYVAFNRIKWKYCNNKSYNQCWGFEILQDFDSITTVWWKKYIFSIEIITLFERKSIRDYSQNISWKLSNDLTWEKYISNNLISLSIYKLLFKINISDNN